MLRQLMSGCLIGASALLTLAGCASTTPIIVMPSVELNHSAAEPNRSVAGTRSTAAPQAARLGQVGAPENAGNTAAEAQVLALTNAERARGGCPPLQSNSLLTRVAREHSRDMALHHYFAHNTPGGRSPFDRMDKAGYPYRNAAENIAAGQPSAQEVVHDWMASPTHRENIMDCSLKELGVGLYLAGSSARYSYYWTQDFGTR